MTNFGIFFILIVARSLLELNLLEIARYLPLALKYGAFLKSSADATFSAKNGNEKTSCAALLLHWPYNKIPHLLTENNWKTQLKNSSYTKKKYFPTNNLLNFRQNYIYITSEKSKIDPSSILFLDSFFETDLPSFFGTVQKLDK